MRAAIVHNNFLYVFGEISILIFQGIDDPTHQLTLADSVNGIGCIARDSVAPIGRDLFFLDANGVRSMSRVIQEKSAPIGDVSMNIHTRLDGIITEEPDLQAVRADFLTEDHPPEKRSSLAWVRDKVEAEDHAFSFSKRFSSMARIARWWLS